MVALFRMEVYRLLGVGGMLPNGLAEHLFQSRSGHRLALDANPQNPPVRVSAGVPPGESLLRVKVVLLNGDRDWYDAPLPSRSERA